MHGYKALVRAYYVACDVRVSLLLSKVGVCLIVSNRETGQKCV